MAAVAKVSEGAHCRGFVEKWEWLENYWVGLLKREWRDGIESGSILLKL